MGSGWSFEAVLAELRRRLGPGTRWIGIDGLGGSGKTTLAGRLASALPGAVVVHLDDFARLGVPTWDHQLFTSEVLEPLGDGRPAHYRRWDHRTDSGRDWVQVPTGVPVIAEGVSATDVAVPVPWLFTVWVETPESVRLDRIAARDGDALAQRWRTDWIPAEQRYFAEQRPDRRADAILSGVGPSDQPDR